MHLSVQRGLDTEGVIQGGLGVRRQAYAYQKKAFNSAKEMFSRQRKH